MNTLQPGSKDTSKQLEYMKQQQQLRAFGNKRNTVGNKPLSADSMIEHLLSKKETFQKRNPETQQKQEPPSWLTSVHPLYERIWLGVQSSGGLADTAVLSSLLMTSGLPTDTLGYIWSLANLTVPGALTQQEVYLVLALVGLAQTGYVVNNLAALLQVPQVPVPALDLTLLPSRVAGHVYPNPLSVNTLPDPVSYNWVTQQPTQQNSSSKIEISYVSSGPTASHKLQTDQGIEIPNDNLSGFDTKDNSKQRTNTVTNNLAMDIQNLDIKTYGGGHTKNSSNTFSFSFPTLNESPSHIATGNPEETDPFDDEFTDFQSAGVISASPSLHTENCLNSLVSDEDEFSNFQKASPKFEDDLSVLVVGGRNIPSAQQLWVAENPVVKVEKENSNGKGAFCSELHTMEDDKEMNQSDNIVKRDLFENKYDAFQEIQYDSFSVFHNPLPEDEDKQSVTSGKTVENVNLETRSIFNHSLFVDSDSSLDLFKNTQEPIFELPKLSMGNNPIQDVPSEEDDDEFSNFQTFPMSLSSANSNYSTEKEDKYDVFRTIVFQDTNFEENPQQTQISKPQEPLQETFSQINMFETNMETANTNFNHTECKDIFDKKTENQGFDDIKFGDFQGTPAVLTSTKDSNIDSLFSSLAISEKVKNDNKNDSYLNTDPKEDRYKALRLLETASEGDEFGEFLGAELPNSDNESQRTMELPSVQSRCLEACLGLLKAGLATLSRASSQEIVSEVLSDPRASTYLDCLLEVHRVSERIICNLEKEDCSVVIAELRHIWESLSPYFTHTAHSHLTETVGAVCGVCKSNTGPSPVTFGAMTFHTPCANLYLHCVEPVLPNVTATMIMS